MLICRSVGYHQHIETVFLCWLVSNEVLLRLTCAMCSVSSQICGTRFYLKLKLARDCFIRLFSNSAMWRNISFSPVGDFDRSAHFFEAFRPVSLTKYSVIVRRSRLMFLAVSVWLIPC